MQLNTNNVTIDPAIDAFLANFGPQKHGHICIFSPHEVVYCAKFGQQWALENTCETYTLGGRALLLEQQTLYNNSIQCRVNNTLMVIVRKKKRMYVYRYDQILGGSIG